MDVVVLSVFRLWLRPNERVITHPAITLTIRHRECDQPVLGTVVDLGYAAL